MGRIGRMIGMRGLMDEWILLKRIPGTTRNKPESPLERRGETTNPFPHEALTGQVDTNRHEGTCCRYSGAVVRSLLPLVAHLLTIFIVNGICVLCGLVVSRGNVYGV